MVSLINKEQRPSSWDVVDFTGDIFTSQDAFDGRYGFSGHFEWSEAPEPKREADLDIEADRVDRFETVEAMIHHLRST